MLILQFSCIIDKKYKRRFRRFHMEYNESLKNEADYEIINICNSMLQFTG